MEVAPVPKVPAVAHSMGNAKLNVESELLPKPMTAASVHPNPLLQAGEHTLKSKNSDLQEMPWTADEDSVLRSAVQNYGKKNWKLIALVHKETGKYERSHLECMKRWNQVLRPGLIKGAWSDKEDRVLKEAVMKLQAKNAKNPNWKCNWSKVSLLVPGRTAKQCRERWRCNLDPNINKADWSEEEDTVLLSMQCTIGNRWALIAKSLPGRTENAIKTRFRSIQRANKKRWTKEEDAIILAMRAQKGTRWESIAEALPNRTKNGVKVRHKQLIMERELEEEESNVKQGAKRKTSNTLKSESLVQSKKESNTKKAKPMNTESDTKTDQTTNSNFVNSATQFVPQPILNPQTMLMNAGEQIAFANSQAALFATTQMLMQHSAAQLKPETIGHVTPISTAPMNSNYSWKIQIDPQKEAANRTASTLVNLEHRAAATLLNMATGVPMEKSLNKSNGEKVKRLIC